MTLILIPTAYEAAHIFDVAPSCSSSFIEINSSTTVALCGFGLAASGSGTVYAISHYKSKYKVLPNRAILMGLAGSYDLSGLPTGTICTPKECACYGIGKGSSEDFISADDMGWKQGLSLQGKEPIGDLIPLDTDLAFEHQPLPSGLAITVAAASKSREDSSRICARYPSAQIEDMETFSVALACRLYDIKLSVIRAVSNEVATPFEHWHTDKAFAALRAIVGTMVPGV